MKTLRDLGVKMLFIECIFYETQQGGLDDLQEKNLLPYIVGQALKNNHLDRVIAQQGGYTDLDVIQMSLKLFYRLMYKYFFSINSLH